MAQRQNNPDGDSADDAVKWQDASDHSPGLLARLIGDNGSGEGHIQRDQSPGDTQTTIDRENEEAARSDEAQALVRSVRR